MAAVTEKPLILASSSPRRRELLGTLAVPFEVITADVIELEELTGENRDASYLAMANAGLKAEAVARLHPGRWILGADTVVALARRVQRRITAEEMTLSETQRSETLILGTPASAEQARSFLAHLSGRTHDVITGCVLIAPNGQKDSFHDISHVTFRSLTEEMISRYLAAVDVMDKAGAYALQEQGDWIVEGVKGSRSNIIGLPLEKLAKVLRAHGLLA